MKTILLKFANVIGTSIAVLTGLFIYWLIARYIGVPLFVEYAKYVNGAFDAFENRHIVLIVYSSCIAFLVFMYTTAIAFLALYLSCVPYWTLRSMRARWRVRHTPPLTETELRGLMLRGIVKPAGWLLTPEEGRAQMAKTAPQLAHMRSKVTVAAAMEAARRRHLER